MLKKCSHCEVSYERTLKYFHKANREKDGLANICKKCKKEIDANYRNNNKEKIKEYQKTPKYVFSQLKHQAKKRGIQFELDYKYYIDNLANNSCYFCGSDNTKHWIDRYHNSHKIGYTIKNTVSCCELCNKMKMALEPNEFIQQCVNVCRHSKR